MAVQKIILIKPTSSIQPKGTKMSETSEDSGIDMMEKQTSNPKRYRVKNSNKIGEFNKHISFNVNTSNSVY